MTTAPDSLPTNAKALRALLLSERAQHAEELAAARGEVSHAQDEIGRLMAIIKELQRHRFGRRSERLESPQPADHIDHRIGNGRVLAKLIPDPAHPLLHEGREVRPAVSLPQPIEATIVDSCVEGLRPFQSALSLYLKITQSRVPSADGTARPSVRAELAAWLERKPDHVRLVGYTVLSDLSAMIGAQRSPETVRRLVENMTVLERLAKRPTLLPSVLS
jgi:hypothetical protein